MGGLQEGGQQTATLVSDSRLQPGPFLGRMLQANGTSLNAKQLQRLLAGAGARGDGRVPGLHHHWVLQVGTQEHRPSDAVFTKVKNINNMHYAPPVVSTRLRCVQESACVYTCAHTRTRCSWRRILLSAGLFQPGCSQY